MSPSAIGTTGMTSQRWERFAHEPGEQVAYPSTDVRYYRLSLRCQTSKDAGELGIKLQGSVPSGCRYFSLVTYDEKMGGEGDEASRPLNHVRLRAERSTPPGNRAEFTAYVLPKTYDRAKFVFRKSEIDRHEVNTTTFVSASLTPEMWIRFYGMDRELCASDLPQATPFNVVTGETVAWPERAPLPSLWPLYHLLKRRPGLTGDDVRFYRPLPDGLYPLRGDNQYLIGMHRTGGFSFLRFRPPRFVVKNFAPVDDVLYYSFSLGGGLTQTTSPSLTDVDLEPADDGCVYLVVGPSAERDKVAALGRQRGLPLHYMEEGIFHFDALRRNGYRIPRWLDALFALKYLKNHRVIIYRNLLADPAFAGNMHHIREFRKGKENDVRYYANRLNVGEYAPRGRRYGDLPQLRQALEAGAYQSF